MIVFNLMEVYNYYIILNWTEKKYQNPTPILLLYIKLYEYICTGHRCTSGTFTWAIPDWEANCPPSFRKSVFDYLKKYFNKL